MKTHIEFQDWMAGQVIGECLKICQHDTDDRESNAVEMAYRIAKLCLLKHTGDMGRELREAGSLRFFSTRTAHCLKNEGIETVGDLKKMTTRELMQIPNFGKVCLLEVCSFLESLNLSLAGK